MHGTKVKCDFNKAINMHFRGPTEQHFYVWEPHCGYLLKVKKVSLCPLIEEGHRLAIILENVLVPPCSILLTVIINDVITKNNVKISKCFDKSHPNMYFSSNLCHCVKFIVFMSNFSLFYHTNSSDMVMSSDSNGTFRKFLSLC